MIPISQAWCCQIDVTNYCTQSCLYCSRYNRHLRKDQREFMSVDQFLIALDSLRGWPSKIGIIGGEPLLHPDFDRLCVEIRCKFDRSKLGLWTSGGANFEKYRELIELTFGFVAYNEHSEEQKQVCKHQPLTIAITDTSEPTLAFI